MAYGNDNDRAVRTFLREMVLGAALCQSATSLSLLSLRRVYACLRCIYMYVCAFAVCLVLLLFNYKNWVLLRNKLACVHLAHTANMYADAVRRAAE